MCVCVCVCMRACVYVCVVAQDSVELPALLDSLDGVLDLENAPIRRKGRHRVVILQARTSLGHRATRHIRYTRDTPIRMHVQTPRMQLHARRKGM
jgi:hypothetical protein